MVAARFSHCIVRLSSWHCRDGSVAADEEGRLLKEEEGIPVELRRYRYCGGEVLMPEILNRLKGSRRNVWII